MRQRCGELTSRGLLCANPVSGDWPCHLHGGPSAEEAKRRIREQNRARAEQRVRDAEDNASATNQADYIRELEHKIERADHEHGLDKSTVDDTELENRKLDAESEQNESQSVKNNQRIKARQKESQWRATIRRLGTFLLRLDPYIRSLRPIIEAIIEAVGGTSGSGIGVYPDSPVADDGEPPGLGGDLAVGDDDGDGATGPGPGPG